MQDVSHKLELDSSSYLIGKESKVHRKKRWLDMLNYDFKTLQTPPDSDESTPNEQDQS